MFVSLVLLELMTPQRGGKGEREGDMVERGRLGREGEDEVAVGMREKMREGWREGVKGGKEAEEKSEDEMTVGVKEREEKNGVKRDKELGR